MPLIPRTSFSRTFIVSAVFIASFVIVYKSIIYDDCVSFSKKELKKYEEELSKKYRPTSLRANECSVSVEVRLRKGEHYYKKIRNILMNMISNEMRGSLSDESVMLFYFKAKSNKKLKESFLVEGSGLKNLIKMSPKKYKWQKYVLDSLSPNFLLEMDEMLRQIYDRYNPDKKPPKFFEVLDGFYLECIGKKEGNVHKKNLKRIKIVGNAQPDSSDIYYKERHIDFLLDNCE